MTNDPESSLLTVSNVNATQDVSLLMEEFRFLFQIFLENHRNRFEDDDEWDEKLVYSEISRRLI